ncbi:hypothetical protein [Streptomyces flaveolus]|uniref:hypothetical protein n=1 Tax=Streptomyces flaveolus TaxID=67297 RepID=UPI00378EB9E3
MRDRRCTVLFAGHGRALLQSRNGADLSGAFAEITAAGRALREPLVRDDTRPSAASTTLRGQYT